MNTTRFGDYNFTKCVDGNIVKKDSPLIEFSGAVDELISAIGIAKSLIEKDYKLFNEMELYNELDFLQKTLISLPNIDDKILAKEIIKMDKIIYDYECRFKEFVFPSDMENSIFHYIRALIRKVERRYIQAFKTKKRVSMFLNRLSLYFFIIAETI